MLKLNEIKEFLENEIWNLQLDRVKGIRHFAIKFMRSLIIAWRDFKKDNCQLKASALTFYTLLSIVPVIAMLFGIAKGFGFEKKLEGELKTDISYNQEIISYVFEFANSMLENTKGGLIAGLGVAMLFWAVMKVLGNIEAAFNDIWEIKTPRSLVRKFSDYLSIMLIAPVLSILSTSITVFINNQVMSATQSIELLGYFGPVIYFILELLPILLTVSLFAIIYIVLPNTKVKFSAAFFGALFAAIIFLLVEWIYISFQVGVSKYNAIYGGFAALPLFLGWVQTNWLVVLLGAELSFAFQNQSKYEFDIDSKDISQSYRYVLSIAVVQSLILKFKEGEEGPNISEISESMHIPAKITRRVLNDLVQCRVVNEIISSDKESRYAPAIDIAKLDINFILRQLNDFGIKEISLDKSDKIKSIEDIVKKAQEDLAKSENNILIKDL